LHEILRPVAVAYGADGIRQQRPLESAKVVRRQRRDGAALGFGQHRDRLNTAAARKVVTTAGRRRQIGMPRPTALRRRRSLAFIGAITTAIASTLSSPARADTPAKPPAAEPVTPPEVAPSPARWRVSTEMDVVRLALGSLSLHVMFRPPGAPRLRLSIGRVGGALPSVFHRLFDPNKGWEAREQGAVLQGFYHLRNEGSTLFVGLGARFEAWEWRRPELAGKATGQQLFVMPSVGFRWFPTQSGLFVTPWVGLGVSAWSSGAGKLGEHTYEPLRFFPIAAVHIGYEL
jgi:hypothetical protein